MAIVSVASVKIKPDLSDLRSDLETGLKRINATLTVAVNADVTHAKADIDKFIAERRGDEIHQELRVDTGKALAEVKAFSAFAGRNSLKFDVAIDPLKKVASLLPGIASTMGKVGAASLVASGGAQLMSASFDALWGVAPLLAPTIIGAAGAMIAIKLGADGAKKAFEGLKPAVDSLKGAVSTSFEKSLKPAVDNLKGVLPQLTVGLKATATAMGGVATRFTEMLNSGGNAKKLSDIFNQFSRVIQNLGAPITNLAQGFINVGAVAAPIMAQLSVGAKNFGAEWAKSTGTKAGADAIKAGIEDAIGTFRALMNIAKQVFGIVSGVFKGLQSGGAGLGNVFLSLVTSLNTFINSAAGQGALASIGKLLAQLGQIVAGTLLVALNALAPAIPPIAQALGLVANIIGASLGVAIQAIAPILPVLANAFAQIASVVSSVFLAALTAIAPIIPPVITIIQQLATAFGNILVGAIQAFAPLLPPIVALIQQLVPIMQVWMQALLQVGQAVAGVLLVAIQAIAPLLPVLAQAFTSILNAVTPLIPVIAGLFTQALNALVPLIPPLIALVVQLVQAFVPLLPPLLQLVSALLPPITALFTAIMPIVQAVIGVVVGLVQALVPLIPIFTDMINAILPPLINLFQTIAPFIAQVVNVFGGLLQSLLPILGPLFQLIGSILPPLINLFTIVAKPVLALAGFLANILGGAIKVITGLFQAISPVIKAVGEVAGWLADKIGSVFGAIGDVIKGALDVAWKIIKGILNVVIKGINLAIKGLNLLPGVNISEIPLLAEGGDITHSGTVIVGDAGPEMLELPKGARVTPLTGKNAPIASDGGGFSKADIAEAVAAGFAQVQIRTDPSGQQRIVRTGASQNYRR